MAKRDNFEFENSGNDDFQETFGTAILGQQDPEDRDNVTTTVNNNSENPEKAIDDELALIENTFEYLTKKKYPPGCSKNHKRIIRRKAERLEE